MSEKTVTEIATTEIETDWADGYLAVREHAGLINRSERGKLALSGPDAKEFLHGQVTNDILALRPGTGRYAAFLTPKGKMLGDLRVLDSGDELLLDTERVALQPLFDMVRRHSIGYDLQLHKRTLQCGLLSLLGPASGALLSQVLDDAGALPATEHDHIAVTIAGRAARAIRTDLGFDLLCSAEDTDAVHAALVSGSAQPIAEEAAECVRIESGRPRYGVELDDSVIPQEAGLNARAVSFTKGCYVGQETVARLFYKGKPNRQLRGLRCNAPLVAGTALNLNERAVGVVGGATISPRFGPIALALVRREAPPGTTITIAGGTPAEVVELPFASDRRPPA